MGTSRTASHLPLEVLTAIFEQVDNVRDLCHVRTGCRTFCAITTPFAFRVLSVIATGKSSKNPRQLFDVPDIAVHVREVAYLNIGAPRKGRRLKHIRTNVIRELASSFSRVHQLPWLETINLTFHPLHDSRLDSDGQDRLAAQASILSALVDSFGVRAPKLTSLSLANLRVWELSYLESPPFQTVLTTLQHLLLSVLSDRAPDRLGFRSQWGHFWGTVCPRMILAPTQPALMHLTLHSDALVGTSSGLSFAGLHFPHLCALSLRKLVFQPSVGVEPFVLQHATTLMQLEVLACKLAVPRGSPHFYFLPTAAPAVLAWYDDPGPKPDGWDRIWDRFAEELTALVTLNVDPECRYVELMFFWELHASRSCNEADAAALQRFRMTVTSRSEETHKGGRQCLTS